MTLRNRNIVFVLTTTELGGAERQAILLARGLREQFNGNISFICFGKTKGRSTELLEQYGFNYRIIRSFSLFKVMHLPFALMAMLRFLLELRRRKADVILPYCYDPNVWTGLVKPLLGKRPLVVWNQRDDGRGGVSDIFNRSAIKHCAHFIANSDAGAEYLIQQLFVKPEKVSVVYNGVEEAVPAVSRTEWRAKYGFADDALLVCMLANLHDQKDHETLLKAWQILLSGKQYDFDSKLLLAGRAQNTEEKLRKLAEEYGITESVVFMGAVKDVHSLLGAIDISVLCAFEKSEGLPNAVLESMLHSLPVSGTDVAALRCALGDDMAGWLSPVRNAEGLAAILAKLFSSKAIRAELGGRNRKRQEKVFSLPALIGNSERIISKLLEN